MATPRGTKLRQFPPSGADKEVIPSRSRPRKPPAKVLSQRKAAALSTGGGRLPPRVRKELDREPMPKRVRKPERPGVTRTRAGKREPRAGRRDHSAA